MYRVPKSITLSIAEYFDLRSYGIFSQTNREYKSIMQDAKLELAEIKNLTSQVARQPVIKNLIIKMDTPNTLVYDLVQKARTQKIVIESKFPMEMKFPPGLIQLIVTCPFFIINEPLPSSLKIFEATTIIQNNCDWPQLRVLNVRNPENINDTQVMPKITSTDLHEFTYPCIVDKVSQLPTSLRLIGATVHDMDVLMPNLVGLISPQLPNRIANCPNLQYWQGDYNPLHTAPLTQLPNFNSIWIPDLDVFAMMELTTLPYLHLVGTHGKIFIDLNDFKKILPHCNLYSGDKCVVERSQKTEKFKNSLFGNL